MAVDRFQLTVEANTRGEQDLARMEGAINRFNATAEKTRAKSAEVGKSFQDAGSQISGAFADPVQAATGAIEGLFAKLGPTGAAMGAFTTASLAAGAGVLMLAKSFGDLYEQQANNSMRLGVTIREYSQLSLLSEQAGLSADALVGSMKGLSKALSDNSDEGRKAKAALAQMGITALSVEGEARPMRDMLLDIADKLGGITDPAKRADAAMKILGRSGIELLPLMNSELRQQVVELEKAGYGWTQYGEQVGRSTDQAFDKFQKRLSEIKRNAGGLAAELFLVFSSARPGLALGGRMDARDAAESFARQRRLGDLYDVRLRDATGRVYSGPGPVSDARFEQLANEATTSANRRKELAAEAAAKASEKAAKASAEAAEKLRDYTRAVIEQGLGRRVGSGTLAYLNPEFGRGGFTSYQGPSLLRAGERVNTGLMGIDPAQAQARTDRAMEAARATTDYQARRVQLMTGPGGEIAAVQTATSIRLAALQEELALGASIFDIERQRLQITRDGELQILEIQKARAAELRQTGGSIFDAITAGGGGLKQYASGYGLGIGRSIFSNTYAEFAGGLAGKFSMTSNPNSLMGRILQGTPFGADPNAQAGAVQLSAAQVQMQAAQMQMTAASGGGFGGVGSLMGLASGGSGLPSSVAMLNPFYKSGGLTTRAKYGIGLGAGLGVMSGIQQGGAAGALTSTASLAGGAAAILPMLSSSLALAGPIGGAIAIGATLAMAFLPDPKQARRMALEEQGRQRAYDEATGVEYTADLYGRSADYDRRGGLRVYLNVDAMDAQSIIDRQADIGEAVRQALSSYPPLALDVKGAALGA